MLRGRLPALAVSLLLGAAAATSATRQTPTRLPGERADVIVAQDGSGDFRSIQPALDAIPKNNATNKTILIRNGVYREKLYITASHIALVGEDRDATRIEFAELRKIWRETHPNDYGAAVINIDDNVTDLVLANLTVRKDPDSKLVIRQSRFDGVPDFPLGRNNRDGQFYLLDCLFSANMADRAIYRPSAPETYAFPERCYYWNSHREGGDFSWFANNLAAAETAPDPRAVTARWTFAGKWDPEGTLPAVLPFASIPRPSHGAQDTSLLNTRLRWTPGRNAISHNVYFGTGNPPRFRANQSGTSFDPGPLDTATTYYWRVDSITPGGVVQGPVWTFMTSATVRFVLAGDSTVTDDVGWGRGFTARLTSHSTVANLARNGRSSRSFIDEGHWRAALAQGADVILIQFGHNDMPGKGPERETDPETTYRAFLARYIDDARAAEAVPVIITSLTRRNFTAAGEIASDLGPYVDAAKAVAAEKGVTLVDLHAASIALLNSLGPKSGEDFGLLKEDGTLDRTHLSKAGSTAFGAIVADELRKALPVLGPYIKPPLDEPGRPPRAAAMTKAPQSIAWSRCLDQPAAWYASDDAVRIADLVRLYQRHTGGWAKNIDMARPLDASERAALEAAKKDSDSTIDNGATTTQLRFLALVYAATRHDRLREAFLQGIDYLLAAQYPNGGWPQYFPLRADYSRHITFNDDAMVHVMEVLRDAAAGKAPYVLVDSPRRAGAADAVLRGVRVILAAQIRVEGRLTAWCAQHDEVTLEPRKARTYEHPSQSGRESVGIASFLMSIPKPDAAVVAAVDAAAAWLREVKLEGLRVEDRPDPALPGGFDRIVVKDPAAPPVWARFYEIGTNRPIFSGRNSVIRYDMAEIEHERRVNYAWYGAWPAALVDREYPEWKRQQAR
jgi:PelA/Pel-15E family pectate lyase